MVINKLKNNLQKNEHSSGFTLVELLIVIAVLGVLASVVLIAINPIERLAQARDSGRKSSVAQLGRGLSSYFTNNSALPTANATWITTLQTSGDIKIVPSNPAGVIDCTNNEQPNPNGYCYLAAAPDYVVYTHMESNTEKAKGACTTANTWYVYSSLDGKGGTYCGAENTVTVKAYGATLLP